MESGQIIDFLKANKDEITKRFSVQRIGLFGSQIRGDATVKSDADILVEMDNPTFDHYMDLKFYIEEGLGIPVDLVLADSVKPRLKSIINSEVAYA